MHLRDTDTPSHDSNGLLATIQAMDALSFEGLGEIERIVAEALKAGDQLPPGLHAALDSVWFLAQRTANDINCHAESQGAECRLAWGCPPVARQQAF